MGRDLRPQRPQQLDVVAGCARHSTSSQRDERRRRRPAAVSTPRPLARLGHRWEGGAETVAVAPSPPAAAAPCSQKWRPPLRKADNLCQWQTARVKRASVCRKRAAGNGRRRPSGRQTRPRRTVHATCARVPTALHASPPHHTPHTHRAAIAERRPGSSARRSPAAASHTRPTDGTHTSPPPHPRTRTRAPPASCTTRKSHATPHQHLPPPPPLSFPRHTNTRTRPFSAPATGFGRQQWACR